MKTGVGNVKFASGVYAIRWNFAKGRRADWQRHDGLAYVDVVDFSIKLNFF